MRALRLLILFLIAAAFGFLAMYILYPELSENPRERRFAFGMYYDILE
jgi:hypothetical protein